MSYEFEFLEALALTIFIETIVMFILVKVFFTNFQIKTGLIILAGITASFATLPYLWFILPIFIKSGLYFKIVSESSAVVLESFILLGILRVGYKNALIISFVCNMTSFVIGLILNLT
jgi:hypothetical protein